MKYIENPDIWKICIEVFDSLDTELSSKISCPSQRNMSAEDKKEIMEEFLKLAKYTYEKDIVSGHVSQLELSQMEENGLILGSHIFCRMARHYYFMEQATGEDHRKERILCATIHANLGNTFFFEPNHDVIEGVVKLGIQLLDAKRHDFITSDYSDGIVNALHILHGYGIEPSIQYGTFDCNERINHEIFELLKKKVKMVGGLAVLMYLGKTFFWNYYSPDLDRYMISRSTDNRQSTPVQLLISLAIKHLNINDKNYDKKECQCREIIDLAQAWYNILEVEGESGIEYAMATVNRYPLELYNQIIVDKFCIPKQYTKDYILASLDHMIQPLFYLCNKKYSYSDYRKVACYLMNQPFFIGVLDRSEMKRQLDVANYKIDLILEDISIPAMQVNAEFTNIDAACNHYKWPLIRFPMERYVYIDYHICGFGFYNVIYEIIKRCDGSLDKKQGIYVENMLKEELQKKGYGYFSGKYAALKEKNLNDSECDLVMQSNSTFFFEVKKTSISDELENMDDVIMLQQLAKGMVRAQKQCFLHELYLRENGSICLEDNGVKRVIEPVGELRECLKISVCHQEYSFLTSKSFSSLLLETILSGRIDVKDSARKNDLDALNKLGKQILDIYSRNGKQECIVPREVAFYSLFCSLQQILTALWNSKDEEEFLYMVKEWIYCQDKSLDPYLQILVHIYHRNNPESPDVKKAAIEMFERTNRKSLYIG